MKIKLDENLPTDRVEILTSRGHDVQTVPDEGLAGSDDKSVFAAAFGEGRLFVTQDLDFSDVRKFQPGTRPGTALLRLNHPSRRQIVSRSNQVLQLAVLESWHGCFVVISQRRIRVRKPPP